MLLDTEPVMFAGHLVGLTWSIVRGPQIDRNGF